MEEANLAGRGAVFTIAAVPARAVYLIAEGSRTGFRRAVREATTRWGGACEPIVEVRADATVIGDDRLFVELADLDGAVNVDASEELAAAVARSFDLPLVSIAEIDLTGTTRFTTHPAMLVPPTVDGSNGYVVAKADGPLWSAAAAGDLSEGQEAALSADVMHVRRAASDYEVADAQVSESDLLGRSTAFLGEQWASTALFDSPTIIWLTRGDALADCLQFWNLRALRPLRMASMPMLLLPEDINGWTHWPQTLHNALRRPDRFAPDVMVASATVDRAGLDAFAQSMDLRRADNEQLHRYLWSDDVSVRTAPFTYLIGIPYVCFWFKRKYGELASVDVPVLRDAHTLRFPNPVPVKVDHVGGVLLRVSGEPFDALPRLDCVAKLISDIASWHDDAIQLPAALTAEASLDLRVPSLGAAARAVLDERTRSHATSQKGAIGTGLLTNAALDALAEPLVYEAVCSLTTPRSRSMAAKLRRLFTDDHPLTEDQAAFAAQFAGRGEQVYRCAARLGHGDPDTAASALERLIDIGWAERGLETNCQQCGLKRFVPFSGKAARKPGRCEVCESRADYTRSGDGLTVHYRLTGRVDHANDQGVIAHLMVIGALRRQHRHVWLSPGTDLVFANGTAREVDVFGICDSQLIGGEVKMSGNSFDKAQIRKDIDTSTQLGLDCHIMATTTHITAASKNLAKELCVENGIALLVLEHSDLVNAPGKRE